MKKLLIILAGLITAAIFFYFLKFKQFYQYIYTPIPTMLFGEKPKPAKNQFSVLLLGYAGSNHAGTYLTDTMIVMHVDTKKKKALMISLPRDIWVKLPTKSGEDFHSKINTIYETELFPNDFPDLNTKLAGTKSDAELTKFIVGQLTGLEIDNYVSIDFASFTKAIDILGGVEVDVLKAFDDEKYPVEGKERDLCGKEEQFKLVEPYLNEVDATQSADKEKLLKEKPELDELLRYATESPHLAFPCRYEKIHFDAGSQRMDGATALKFSRSRQSPQDGGDFARAKRQQQILEAVRSKVLSVGFVAKLPSLLDEMKNHVKTDASPDQIKKFLKEAPSAKEYRLTSIVLSDQNVLTADRSDNGQYILTPEEGIDNWKNVQKFIKNNIEGITPTPSPTQKTAPTNDL
ncbi:LCP family protein [Candidatus Roizmanbacteria bacterium]|nr:LCP family protein [Candidatus Roizmanbacteria bacterium]